MMLLVTLNLNSQHYITVIQSSVYLLHSTSIVTRSLSTLYFCHC